MFSELHLFVSIFSSRILASCFWHEYLGPNTVCEKEQVVFDFDTNSVSSLLNELLSQIVQTSFFQSSFWFLFDWFSLTIFPGFWESVFVAKHCIFKKKNNSSVKHYFCFVCVWNDLPCHELWIGTYLLSTVNQESTSSKVLWFLILGRCFSDLLRTFSINYFSDLTYEQQLTFVHSLWIVHRSWCNAVVSWHFA